MRRHPNMQIDTMGLPDLYQVTEALSHVVLAGVAQAADQPDVIPPIPRAPDAVDLRGLKEILVNLGGWGVLLWSLVNSIVKRVEVFGAGVTKRLDSLSIQVRRLAREMRRIRRSPPPQAYSDDDFPSPPSSDE